MLDNVIAWAQHHPLQGVALLVALSIVVALLLIPRVHEISGHNHPRC